MPDEDDAPVALPLSASDPQPSGGRIVPEGAFIRNPVRGKEALTRLEAIDAISILSSILAADQSYRDGPADPRVRNGD